MAWEILRITGTGAWRGCTLHCLHAKSKQIFIKKQLICFHSVQFFIFPSTHQYLSASQECIKIRVMSGLFFLLWCPQASNCVCGQVACCGPDFAFLTMRPALYLSCRPLVAKVPPPPGPAALGLVRGLHSCRSLFLRRDPCTNEPSPCSAALQDRCCLLQSFSRRIASSFS